MKVIDRVHRLPRAWSNKELARFAHLFDGDVVNVSAWQDIDKEGRHYRDYFSAAKSYATTNFEPDAQDSLGAEGELHLDLAQPLPAELRGRFDVVFNHTTLEHIYDLATAFSNLCELSRDIVIIVVPFLQQYHRGRDGGGSGGSQYDDYWRFSPLAVQRMFEERGLTPLHISFNSEPQSSVYVFAIATRSADAWSSHFDFEFSVEDPLGRSREPYIGCNAIPNRGYRFQRSLPRWLRRWIESPSDH